MKQALIKLHLSVIIASFTGIFGKLIALHEGLLVWYRLLITSVVFFMVLWITKRFRRIGGKELLKIMGVGCILSAHWFFFYGSIKASNVAIGVVCFSLTGFFTAILEPIINRHRFSVKELLFSVIGVLGILLIFHFDTRYRLGITLGAISSTLAAIFIICNKHVTANRPATSVLFYEIIGGLVFVSLLLPVYIYFFPPEKLIPDVYDWTYLFLLATICTVGLYILQIQALRFVSPFTVNLTYNLEPVYSIILAMILFSEAKELDLSFYVGLGLIIFSVFLQMWSITRKKERTVMS
ncbi:EamA family transporter [Dysgonomonas sp. 216]|uniref:DMT family transporter n=1 Tax=Dysgonomonas sp. 216 TaxID=2302934 RepID=UPI0013D1670A|nr:DMT family transporter [Dysgonomonas sp. 216]NDW18141.1 EamA family transporter [Dysgonomonas sp. 216]